MELYSIVLGMTILQWAEYLGLIIIIPVVSSKDTIFIKRIFEKSHSIFTLKNQDLLTSNHLSLSQTLQAAIRGITCVDCFGMKRQFKKFIEYCPKCIKMNFNSADGKFTHGTTNARL